MSSGYSEDLREARGLPINMWLKVEETLRALFKSGAYRLGNAAMSMGLDSLARRHALSLPSGLVLDIGCGDGYYSRKLEERGAEVVCLDPLEDVLKEARTAHTVVAVAEYLPFRDGSFDFVLAMFSLRDFLDKPKGLWGMRKVSRKGAVVLDIFNPRSVLLRLLFWAYVAGVAPLLGFLASGVASRWRMLYPTLRYMPTAAALERGGGRTVLKLMGGILTVVFIPSVFQALPGNRSR
ncbi:MAG: methyltransferase domain-containing protein [Thermofilum sp.]